MQRIFYFKNLCSENIVFYSMLMNVRSEHDSNIVYTPINHLYASYLLLLSTSLPGLQENRLLTMNLLPEQLYQR